MAKKIRMGLVQVTGGGIFPFDMLRYDQCWPFSEPDSTKLVTFGEIRTIKLCNASGVWTSSRWKSFAWDVKIIEGIER